MRKQGKEIALPCKYLIKMMNEACAKKAQLWREICQQIEKKKDSHFAPLEKKNKSIYIVVKMCDRFPHVYI